MVVTPYNYPKFNRHYVAGAFDAPKPGEAAPELSVTDLDGHAMSLEDFRGRPLVLETGSMTCPQTIGNTNGMDELARRHPDTQFLMMYVREAHPGNSVPAPIDLDEKRSNAREHVRLEGVSRRVVVDTADGETHRRYGAVPNAVFVIDPDGRVAFSSEWNDARKLEPYVDAVERGSRIEEDADLGFRAQVFTSVRVWRRAGFDALWDVTLTMPFIVVEHTKEAWQRFKERRGS